MKRNVLLNLIAGFLGICILCTCATSQKIAPEKDFKTDGKGKIIRYIGKSSIVVIPDHIGDSPVKAIDDDTFRNNNKIKKVVIPSSVTSIDAYTFADGENLAEIIVVEDNNAYKSIDGVLFNKSGTIIVQYPKGKKGSNYIIPDGVEVIGDYAFHDTNLTSVKLPNSVTSIGKNAFMNSVYLANVNIPVGVTTINGGAFSPCGLREPLIIPVTVTFIGWTAFAYCRYLPSVTISNPNITIASSAFSGCENLSFAIVPRNAKFGDDGKGSVTSAFPKWTRIVWTE